MAVPRSVISLSRDELLAVLKLFDCLRAGISSSDVKFSAEEKSHLQNVDRLLNIAAVHTPRPATGLNR